MPTQLNITVTQNNAGTVTSPVIVVPINAALQALDSGGAQGQVSQLNTTTGIWSTGQTGYSSVDEAIRAIFRAGGFTDNAGNWYPREVIQKITAT